MTDVKKLYRIPEGRIIGGVCTGLGTYFNIDYTLIRLIWVLTILLAGIGFFAYLIAWIIIPERTQFQ